MEPYQTHQLLKSHPYAIVDATLRDTIPADWAQRTIAPAFLGEDTSRCPLLIDLRSLTNADYAAQLALLSMQTRVLEETWASLLLASDKTIDQLAKHLANRLVLKLANEPSPKQFRYFDPGTFLQLPALLGDKGMAWLLAPIHSVVIPWVGEFTHYQKPTILGTSFVLKDAHIQGLYRIGIANRVQNSRAAPPNQAAWVARAKAIYQYIDRALVQGLQDINSLTAFCQHALQHHPTFDEHAKLQAIFAELAHAKPEDELDYKTLTAALSAIDWQHIVTDLLAHQYKQAHVA